MRRIVIGLVIIALFTVATRPATVQVTLSEPAAERLLTKAMG